MKSQTVQGWDRLRHGGLLLDPQRLGEIGSYQPGPLDYFSERDLRKKVATILDDRSPKASEVSDFVFFVLQKVCGFTASTGEWRRGPQVSSQWARPTVTGEKVKPRLLWENFKGGLLPVFLDKEKRVGLGRGRKLASQVLQWLRSGEERLALLTNGRQWRLVFAGLDFDAWCEWDVDLWFEEGELSPQVTALRTLIQPALWIPKEEAAPPPLLQAVLDSRKGQAELSQILGERVREAVELLIQGHGEFLKTLTQSQPPVSPADIYRAAVRIVMRMVVILFAESRELLPRDNALYHNAYGLGGLLEELEKRAARSRESMTRTFSAWPRVLALFRLVHQGSHHPSLPVPSYGGELFAPGDSESDEGIQRALALFEEGCFQGEALNDRDVYKILELLTRTKVKIRQGRSRTWVPLPVDFSDLSSEYIGILYEGLLDFELRTAPPRDPVIFLALGNQPALPLSRLEAMEDKALKSLLEKMKDKKAGKTGEEPEESSEKALEEEESSSPEEEAEAEGEELSPEAPEETEDLEGVEDQRHTTRTRAEAWARHAVEVGGLVKKPRGRMTPEKEMAFQDALAAKARKLVTRVVLPGEWYLVRWGGTRKGSGTFYTRPGLAVPTVHRTLRPLAWNPPTSPAGSPDGDAPPTAWTPKKPEEILALKVLDPACGSGTFLVGSLRFLTDSLYTSLFAHGRIRKKENRSIMALLEGPGGEKDQEGSLARDLLPTTPEDASFEPRLKAILRRHVVEHCIYGVDIDPLAVELCRLSLWIETMDRRLPFSFLDHKIKCGNSLIGAWFDQFQHYPAMAWKNREGGDKNHNNGVHFQKEARTKALKDFTKKVLTPDLADFIKGQRRFDREQIQALERVHDQALQVLEELHRLPVVDAAERSRIYKERLLGSQAWRDLKDAFDLWCACWFWPADKLDCAPLPSDFAHPSPETKAIAKEIARTRRFFHWELEFPDVFRAQGSGFDAVLGNPPWEIAKPNSKEFFSNIDPLYRSYGKQEALQKQKEYFTSKEIEKAWIDYNAGFKAQSNYFKYSAIPFGDPLQVEDSKEAFNLKKGSKELHRRWRDRRSTGIGYADPSHSFRYQGSADINIYKLFLEQAHVLLKNEGRMGLIVPSGLYSDHGTRALRELFLEKCRWEWLFGFENREKIFDIHRSFKFNPVVIQKGGKTEAIRTAFMRRDLGDWEKAESLATPYTRERVERFSPKSKAILEIQSARDLEILEKIYANSVLLGDQGPDGWGVKYAREFDMTNDSKLFPPRPWWEEQGYRPDEYSRWLKGDWRPIEELWAELGVDPSLPVPVEIELEDWLFDTTAGPERRAAEAQFIHGHLLKPGDVARTPYKLRLAQPPYDTLPIPRAHIPPGIILSRNADAWIHEDKIQDIALPLYEGRMIGQFDFSQKGWVSGKGRGAIWREIPWGKKLIEPQYLMGIKSFTDYCFSTFAKVGQMRVSSGTNKRTIVTTGLLDLPCGDKVATLRPKKLSSILSLSAVLNSFPCDYLTRMRIAGLQIDQHLLFALAVPSPDTMGLRTLEFLGPFIFAPSVLFSAIWLRLTRNPDFGLEKSWRINWRLAKGARLAMSVIINCISIRAYEISSKELFYILRHCDLPKARFFGLPAKGFWRVDKDKDPELRQTVLTLVAFHDLHEKIEAAGGDREAGIKAFLEQNHGEGWMLPETLRLADYGLGHDERAKVPQPVASRLGPRFYDWQLTQTAEESWKECHLHARNLLGKAGYQRLLEEIEAKKRGEPLPRAAEPRPPYGNPDPQKKLFE